MMMILAKQFLLCLLPDVTAMTLQATERIKRKDFNLVVDILVDDLTGRVNIALSLKSDWSCP
jgi:hypothetical protein